MYPISGTLFKLIVDFVGKPDHFRISLSLNKTLLHTMRIPTTLLFLALFLDPMFAAPHCCDLERSCLESHRATTGDIRIGRVLTNADVRECGMEGRANWCVAKWTNNNWYCTSPGDFLQFLTGYAQMCDGGVFPTAGEKEPCFGAEDCNCNNAANPECDVALGELQNIVGRLRRPSRRCVVAVNDLRCS